MVGFDIPAEVISVLKKLGMIVVFGNTDDQGNDLMEINGVVSEKFGVDPHVILASGKIMPESHVKSDELVIGRIEPQCHKEENPDGWSYKTDIPHATFRICYEDADDYCVGLVIDYVALSQDGRSLMSLTWDLFMWIDCSECENSNWYRYR